MTFLIIHEISLVMRKKVKDKKSPDISPATVEIERPFSLMMTLVCIRLGKTSL